MSCLCQHFTDLEPKRPVLIHCILNVTLSNSEARTHSSLWLLLLCLSALNLTQFQPSIVSPPTPQLQTSGCLPAMSSSLLQGSGTQDPSSCILLSHVAFNLSSSLPQELGQRRTFIFWSRKKLLPDLF